MPPSRDRKRPVREAGRATGWLASVSLAGDVGALWPGSGATSGGYLEKWAIILALAQPANRLNTNV